MKGKIKRRKGPLPLEATWGCHLSKRSEEHTSKMRGNEEPKHKTFSWAIIGSKSFLK
jgi:hypothetical protein